MHDHRAILQNQYTEHQYNLKYTDAVHDGIPVKFAPVSVWQKDFWLNRHFSFSGARFLRIYLQLTHPVQSATHLFSVPARL